MPAPTLNGLTLLEATISEQSVGVWHAEVALDAETAPVGRVTIAVDELEWLGTVLRAREEHGQVRAKVVGGAGGFSIELPAMDYVKTTAAGVLADILTEAGETLSASVAGLDTYQLSNWHRERATAGIALSALAAELGYSWRVLRDGTVWVGQLTWPDSTATVIELDSDWATGTFELAEGLGLEPGTTYQGERIAQATHFITQKAIRTEARLRSCSGVLERLLERSHRAIDRSCVWPGTVARQSTAAGYPLDVLPDGKDTRVRASGLGSVQILLGLPGFSVRVPEGARGAWSLLGGDPSRPRWLAWEQGSGAAVTEVCFAGGTKAVARVDDTIQAGELYAQLVPSGPAVGAVLALWWSPEPVAGLRTWTVVTSGPIAPLPATPGTPISGDITTGQPKLLA